MFGRANHLLALRKEILSLLAETNDKRTKAISESIRCRVNLATNTAAIEKHEATSVALNAELASLNTMIGCESDTK